MHDFCQFMVFRFKFLIYFPPTRPLPLTFTDRFMLHLQSGSVQQSKIIIEWFLKRARNDPEHNENCTVVLLPVQTNNLPH